MGVSLYISTMTEDSDFKIGRLVAFAETHNKNPTQKKKRAWPCARGAPKIWGFPLIFMQWLKVLTSSLVHSLGDQLGPS